MTRHNRQFLRLYRVGNLGPPGIPQRRAGHVLVVAQVTGVSVCLRLHYVDSRSEHRV
jgi:hypothetical protein